MINNNTSNDNKDNKQYFLKSSNEKIVKKRLYGFDVETYGKYNQFLMGSIVNNTEQYVFWNRQDMINFIFNNHKIRNSLFFATNLGFDFLALFGHDINLLMKFEYIIRGSEFVNIKLRLPKSHSSINFRDSLNFARFSVQKLGQIIGLPKLDKPACLGKKKGVTADSTNGKILEKYNIRDSLVTYRFMEFLQTTFNNQGANLKYTIATTSMNLFRRMYMSNLWILQPPKHILLEMFKAYYGGRCETFYRGSITNGFYYDINSLYPYVMKTRTYPFPNSLQKKLTYSNNNNNTDNSNNNNNLDIIKNYHGISYCDITAPKSGICLMYPLLPYRTPEKLIFPLGKFSNWQTHIELRKALELGYKITPKLTYYYTESFNPFKKFVTTVYNQRMIYKKQNNPMQLPMKIILNSLYGKFAQKLDYMEIFFIKGDGVKDRLYLNNLIKHNIDFYLNKGKPARYKINSPNQNIVKIVNKNETTGKAEYVDNSLMYYITDTDRQSYGKFINPILSLYTTSYARLELFKWIEMIINMPGGKIFYCDTDSIMCNKQLPKSKVNSLIGNMKLEHNISLGLLVKPKMYFIKDNNNTNNNNKELVRAKGLHGLNTFTDFKDVLINKTYKYMKFAKFKESMRSNKTVKFNQKIEIVKHIDLEDTKRTWKTNSTTNFDFFNDCLEKSKPLVIDE